MDLRSPTESLSFSIRSAIVKVRDGYVVSGLSETDIPGVFDIAGRFSRLIARKGSGPGEMGSGDLVVATASDSLWIYDRQRSVRHILSPTLNHVRSTPNLIIPTSVVTDGRGASVFAANSMQSQRAGLPLHMVVGDKDTAASFGRTDPFIDPRLSSSERLQLMTRRLVADGDAFWSFNPANFLLERWNFQRQRLLSITRDWQGWVGYASVSGRGLRSDSIPRLTYLIPSEQPNVIWLVYFVQHRPVQGPLSSLTLVDELERIDLVVEALDWREGKLLAARRFPRTSARPVHGSADVLAVIAPLSDIFAFFQVSLLRLVVG
jgi:hypothetical protein